jgi:hypothetical protein
MLLLDCENLMIEISSGRMSIKTFAEDLRGLRGFFGFSAEIRVIRG